MQNILSQTAVAYNRENKKPTYPALFLLHHFSHEGRHRSSTESPRLEPANTVTTFNRDNSNQAATVSTFENSV